jgi:lipopolysaccharide transport system ATP-binding protein
MTAELSPPAVSVEHLHKSFRLGEGAAYGTLRDVIADAAGRLVGRVKPAPAKRTHHALNDVSFTVQPGEILGVIGGNGAGKSTLLKILSGITDPSGGRCTIRGRVASLLEVGTGFNLELTGRENIFVNGTILGMTQQEIRTKFDDIVAFAGIEEYLDTPVKRYSTGMQVRLGFAVAAHLDPDILLLDEVLAVGDVGFQRRCLGKMGEIASGGRTILFVSHNMEAIGSLCSRVIWLDRGRIRMDGPARDVVRSYLAESMDSTRTSASWRPREERPGNGRFYFTGCRICGPGGEPMNPVIVGSDVRIEVDFRTRPHGQRNGSLRVWVRTSDGRDLVLLTTAMTGNDMEVLPPSGKLICRIPRFPIGPGTYSIKLVGVLGREMSDDVDGAAILDVVPGDYYESGNSFSEYTSFLVDHEWHIEAENEPGRGASDAVAATAD